MSSIHTGDLVAQPGVVYDITEITGTLYASGADTRTAFPALTTTNDRAALCVALARHGLTLDDGILSHVIRRRGPVAHVRRVGSRETSYIVTDGALTAHGRTLAEARADLRVKQRPRDVEAYRGWTPQTVVTLETAIAAYRAITGACGLGVSDFLRGRTLPKRMSVARMLAETRGAYGHDAFAAFICGAQ